MIMIHNARQYRVTKAQMAKFAAALKTFDARPSAHPSVHPKLIEAQRDALVGQLKSLNEELVEYARLRRKKKINATKQRNTLRPA